MNSDSRTRRAKKNIIAMFIIRGLSIAITFLYVPLLLNTLNSVEYGIWLTLTSMVAWINMFDVGLGNGLRNRLSEALSNNDRQKGKELVSTAYVLIFIVAILLIIVFSAVFPFISWTDVLNAPKTLTTEINRLVYIVVIAFCVQFSLSLINSVLYALQLPSFSSLILLLGQLISFLLVWVEVKFLGIDSLLTLGTTISIVPLFTMAVFTLILFCGKYKYLAPNIRLFKMEYVKSIFLLGGQFFILQIITILLFQTNNLIITHAIDNTAVVVYNVAFKLMHAPVLAFTIIVTPMWSAATDAYTRGEFDWLKQINKRLYQIIGLLTLGGIVLVALSQWLYKVWLGRGDLAIPIVTSGILMVQSVFFMLYTAHSYMLNGMGKLRIQMIFTSIFALLYVPAAYYSGVYFGLNGTLLVFAINALLNYCWSGIQFNMIVNHKAKGIWNK